MVLVLNLAVIGSLVGVLITAPQPGHQPWPLVGLVGLVVCWACGWPPPSSRAGAGRGEQQGSTGTLDRTRSTSLHATNGRETRDADQPAAF
jgi:hypothetical protein